MPGFVKGTTQYQADVEVSEKSLGEFDTNIRVTSELVGMTIEAPQPLGKTAADKRLLDIKLSKDDEESSLLQLNYADTVNAVWLLEDSARAEITIGIPDAELPASGIRFRGRLNELSISDWTQWQQTWFADSVTEQNFDNWPAVDIELAVDNLRFNKWVLNDVQTNAFQRNQIWQMDIQSRQLRGDIRWPVDSDSLPTLHFDFVDLQLPASNNQSNGRKNSNPSYGQVFS